MASASDVYDQVLGGILGGAPPDPAAIDAQLREVASTLTKHLKQMVGVPIPNHPFLVPDGQEPGAGQMSETEFIVALLTKVAQELSATDPLERLAASVVSVFDGLIELGNTEVLVRIMLELSDNGVYNASGVVDLLAASLLGEIAGWRDAFERPLDPEVWDPEESEIAARDLTGGAVTETDDGRAGTTATTSVTGALAAMVTTARGPVPKLPGSLPSSGPDGNRVHRYVQEAYANTFGATHNLIVIEAGDRMTPGSPPTTQKLAAILATNQLTDPNDVAKAQTYMRSLINPVTNKRWKPDIADLEDTIALPQLLAPWGWFEIKNWKDSVDGFFQVSKYCAFYTGSVARHHIHRLHDWAALPGLWFPPPVLYDQGAKVIFVITRPLPGVIIYYKLDISDLEKVADVTVSVIMASLVTQFLKRLLTKVTAVQVPVYAAIAWAAVFVVLALAIVALLKLAAAATVAGLAATAQAIVAWMATVVAQLGRAVVVPLAPLGG